MSRRPKSEPVSQCARRSRQFLMLASLVFLLLCLWSAAQAHPDGQGFQARCLSFEPESCIKNATRTVLEFVKAGTNLTFPDNAASCSRSSQVVSKDSCRVALSIPTSNRSSIAFELWLPEEWTGRFLTVGNGGIDGCVRYEDLAYGVQNGFVTAGSNNGHNGTTLISALDNEDVVIDYTHRSLHTTVSLGKELTQRFYRHSHKKSYYLGCSLGGRQGIDAADKYPDDFDAVLAGAPAVDFNNLYSWRASFPLNTSTGYVPPNSWKTWIHDEVLRQCDDLDGVQDGIIEDPILCNFDPAPLACSDLRPVDCLDEEQSEAVRKIYSNYTYPNGTLIFPGMQPGIEVTATTGLLAGVPFPYSSDWFKYVIYNNASWDPYSYTTKDAAVAEAKNPANIRTWPADLRAFRKRGGKLLMFHGLQDQQITNYNTPRFYERIRNSTGQSYAEMDEWVRYFRIAGMGHCSSGPGAWVIGQQGGKNAAGIEFEPNGNVLAALVDWLEKGNAPRRVLGTKFVNDTVTSGVQLQKEHCRWPLTNKYVSGDPSLPGSWRCVEE